MVCHHIEEIGIHKTTIRSPEFIYNIDLYNYTSAMSRTVSNVQNCMNLATVNPLSVESSSDEPQSVSQDHLPVETNNDVTEPSAVSLDATSNIFNHPSSVDDANNSTENPQPLSKNQLKKKRRWEKAMEVKKRRKFQEKQVKIERAKAQGRDLDAERAQQEAARQNGSRSRQREWQARHTAGLAASFQVCIDCSFASYMTAKEINSLALQIRYCYSTNKRSAQPCPLIATSLGGATLDHLQKVNGFEEWSHWAFTVTADSMEDYFQTRKEDLVYLTSDAETTLTTLDPHKIYIIGGLVDRNRYQRLTLDRATKLGIATARLPIQEHLTAMAATRVLTTNHVFALLLKYREHQGCWKKALADVLPHRKEAKFTE